MNFYDRHVLGVVVEPIRKLWLLSDAQIGWLLTAFTLLYAIVGVPLGRLADRWKRNRILSLGIGFWSALTALQGFSWNYASLFVARLGVGIGEASCAPTATSLIGDLFPAKRRARAIAVFMLGLPLGNFLGNMVSAQIAGAYGWRAPFFFACVPGLLLAILATFIVEPVRGAVDALPESATTDGSEVWRILRIPTFRWIIVSGAFFNFITYAINGFLPAYFMRYHTQSLANAGTLTALALGAVGIPGMLVGGWGADLSFKVRQDGRLFLASIALLLASPCWLLAFNRQPGQIVSFTCLIALGYMLCHFYWSCVYAAIQDVIGPRQRGTAMAIYFFVMYLIGGSFGPALIGRLSDFYSRRTARDSGLSTVTEAIRAAGLHLAMYVLPVLTFLVAFALFLAFRAASQDLKSGKEVVEIGTRAASSPD
jgi:MFS family permease